MFADQVKAYEEMPDELREKVKGLTAIHSAALGYAPDGAYGDGDQAAGRSMQIKPVKSTRNLSTPICPRAPRNGDQSAIFIRSLHTELCGYVG